MPPKKATATGTTKKAAAPSHASYKDMIKDAILQLKERNGSSRQAIKKYVQANNSISVTSPNVFDHQFNRGIRAGVSSGEFTQPKGPSGPVKLAKKDTKTATKATPKKPATKAATTKKAPVAKKPAVKAASTVKKTAAAAKPKPKPKAKANASKPRKTAAAAPAVETKPAILGKTKSGRVTKTKAPAATTTKKAVAKKPAAKKAAAKKSATPKKAEASTSAA
ncbi:MAG: hypothetical protein M1825_004848 [Sarcosagium campestre]|nr:MAG: hypothetical protein M1825_004848 [Sarcosagium campestre]